MASAPDSGVEQDTVRELLAQKQALLMELKQYESNSRFNEEGAPLGNIHENSGIIPASTRLQITISTNDMAKKVLTIFSSQEFKI